MCTAQKEQLSDSHAKETDTNLRSIGLPIRTNALNHRSTLNKDQMGVIQRGIGPKFRALEDQGTNYRTEGLGTHDHFKYIIF